MVADLKSIAIYWSILIITILLAWLYEHTKGRKKKWSVAIWMIVIVLPLSILAGMRYSTVGIDYVNYVNIFFRIEKSSMTECFSQAIIEPFFFLIVKLCLFINKSNQFVFFVISFLTNFFAIKAFEKVRNKISFPFAILFYYLLLYHHSYNITRQMLAVSLILYAYTYYMEGKYKKFIILCFLVSMCHTSAIICIVYLLVPFMFHFIWNHTRSEAYGEYKQMYQFKRIIFYFSIMVSPFVVFSLINILQFIPGLNRYVGYIGGDINVQVSDMIRIIIIILPLFLVKDRSVSTRKEFFLMRDCLLFIIPINFIGSMAFWAGRLIYYPQSILIFLVSMIIKNCSNNRLDYWIKLYYIMYFILDYVSKFLYNNNGQTFPYLTW